ncbi:opacity family porin [Sulfurimonas sp.]|uniref:opacity family porin n=1 Tax=Sulfurimonas sp. TaxID=2022749 RepID=UPI002AAF4130|nr:opacity family porin [Sulfurimonas sp.]
MKKIILGILGTVILTTGLLAKDNMYIGAEVGYTNHTIEDDDFKSNSEATYTAYKIGKYFDEYRLSMSLENSSKIGINADYLFIQENTSFTPYLGATIKYNYVKESYTRKATFKKETYSRSVIFLGVTLGFIYEINDSFELDTRCGAEISKYHISDSNGNDRGRTSANQISCGVGINYLFRD